MYLGLECGRCCKAAEDNGDDAVAALTHKGEGFFGFGAHALEEPTADHAVAAVEADFDILFGEVEDLCSLGGAEFLNVAEHDDGAIVFRQAEDGLFEEFA